MVNSAYVELNKTEFLEKGGVCLLTELLKDGRLAIRQQAARGLFYFISKMSYAERTNFIEEGLFKSLLFVIKMFEGNPILEASRESMDCWNSFRLLCQSPYNLEKGFRAEAIPVFCWAIKDRWSGLQHEIILDLLTLSSLIDDDVDVQEEIVSIGIVSTIIEYCFWEDEYYQLSYCLVILQYLLEKEIGLVAVLDGNILGIIQKLLAENLQYDNSSRTNQSRGQMLLLLTKISSFGSEQIKKVM